LSLGQTTDSRIAAHLGYGVFADANKAGFGTDFSSSMSSLDASVTRPNNNAIELVCFHSVSQNPT